MPPRREHNSQHKPPQAAASPEPKVATSPHVSLLSPTSLSCKTCKFWYKTPEDLEVGNCKRYPPAILDPGQLHALGPVTRHPLTLATNICGEHQPQAMAS